MDAVDTIEVHIDALSGVEHRVIHLEAQECVNELSTIEVRMVVQDAPMLRELLASSASIVLRSTDERERHWHGLVTSARLHPRAGIDFEVRLTIRPRAFRLTLGQDSRIFQGQNIPSIVEDVLRRGGLPDDSWEWRLSESLPAHTNVVQYNESDWEFCLRLLAEEGVSFVVQHGQTRELLLFFDSTRAYDPTPEIDTLTYRAEDTRALDGVFEVSDRHRVTTRAVSASDYDLHRSTRPLRANAGSGAQLGAYLHPAGFSDEDAGARRARRYAEGFRWGRHKVIGHGDSPWLEPGKKFQITNHDRADLNDEYVTARVTHRCTRADRGSLIFTTDCFFEAIPAATIVRPDPLRGLARPIGLQSAFVTAPLALEHIADEHGRIKVRFPWDRSGNLDATSSTWSRVGQLHLTGALVLPRAGAAVYVESEQGDRDRHLVTGHRYNAEQLVPYPLPARTAVSSWQSNTLYRGPLANELRFDDTAGSEEVYFHASMNLRGIVRHDAVRRITHCEQVMVGVRQALAVNRNHTAVVGGIRTVSVGRNQSLRVDESYSESVGQDSQLTCDRRRLRIGGDLSESVRGDLTRTVGPLEAIGAFGGYSHRTLGNSTTTAGALWAERIAGDRVSRVQGNRTETVDALKHIEAGTIRIAAAGGYEETFDELEIEIGGDRSDASSGAAAWEASGALDVTGDSISITGTSSLTLTAGSCTITLASSGTVTLQAPRVNLRNARSIGSTVLVN